MEINLECFDKNNKIINSPKPIWFEHYIGEQGTKRIFQFTFIQPISTQIQKIKIQIDNDPVQMFIVDKFERTQQHKKMVFTLTASHPIGLIAQNNLLPQQWDKFSIQTLMETFCKPFQIKSIKPELTLKSDQTIPFYTTLGMTNWDAITLFFRKEYNCCVYIDKNNSITTKYIPKPTIIFDSTDTNLVKIEQIENRAKLFSTIMVQKINDEPNAFSTLNLKNPSIEQNNIKRRKFFKVPAQYELMPNRGAQAIFDRINAKHKTVILKFTKTMQPLFPGTIVKVTDNNKSKLMCINSFKTSTTSLGSFTEINLSYSDLVN